MKKSSPGSTQLPTSRHLLSPSQPLIFTSVTYVHTSCQHIWQWHGTFEDCQSVRPWVWDQFSISIVLPVLSHGPVCTVIVSLLDILGVVIHICIHWPLIGFRLAIRGLGRIEGPRKASNMLICLTKSLVAKEPPCRL